MLLEDAVQHPEAVVALPGVEAERQVRPAFPVWSFQVFQTARDALFKQLRGGIAVVDSEHETAEPLVLPQAVTAGVVSPRFRTAEVAAAFQDIADQMGHMVPETGRTGGVRQHESGHAGVVGGLLADALFENLVKDPGREQAGQVLMVHRVRTERRTELQDFRRNGPVALLIQEIVQIEGSFVSLCGESLRHFQMTVVGVVPSG